MIKKFLDNIFWLILDKFFVLLLQFFIGIKIINYYGGEEYGYYSYAVSIFALFPVVTDLLNTRIIKIKLSFNEKYILNIKNFFKYISLLSILIILCFKTIVNEKLFYLLFLLSINNFFLVNVLGIEIFYEYKLKSKKIVYSNMIAKVIILLLQYIFVYYAKDIYYIAVSQCVGNLLRYIFLLHCFKKDFNIFLINRNNNKIIKEIILESKFFWLANTANLFFIQADRIMLGKMIGMKEVAIYTVALQLISILEIPLIPISNTVFPYLIENFKKNYDMYKRKIIELNSYVTYFYIIISLVSIYVVNKLFLYFFNREYIEAIYIYQILVIGTIIKANIILRSSHLALIKKGNILLGINICGMISSVILNFLFIPYYGMRGAAIATVISRVIIVTSCVYSIEGREWLLIQLKSFNIKNLLKRG